VKRYLIIVIGALAAVVCVRLGIWQLDRLEQRKARNANIGAGLAAQVLDLTALQSAQSALDSLHFRRARAVGRYDFHHEVVLMARAHRGVPGVHVVTPLLLDDSTAVLVERGWIPSPDGRQADLALYREPIASEAQGVLLIPTVRRGAVPPAETWPVYALTGDPEPLAARLPYRLFPLLLRRTEEPESMPTSMQLVASPELDNGPHLSYALQWFTFATIALVGSVLLFRRGREREERDKG
jgi:surfeit locus 1 family protein